MKQNGWERKGKEDNDVKKLLFAGAVAVAMLALVSAAQADSFTFNFDKIIDPNDPNPPTLTTPAVLPVGTLTISDDPTNTNWVDVRLELFAGHGAANEFLFNYLGAGGFTLASGEHFVMEDGNRPATMQAITGANQADVDAYNNHFDLDVTVTDGAAFPKVKIFNAVLKLQLANSSYVNLDASDFNFTDNNGLYAYEHPVSCAPTNPPTVNGCTASELDSFNYVATTVVPEPATMFLGGLGLIAFGYAARRRLFGR